MPRTPPRSAFACASAMSLALAGCSGAVGDASGAPASAASSGSGGAATTSGAGGVSDRGGAGGAASTTGAGGAGDAGGAGGQGGSTPRFPFHRVGRFDDSEASRPKASWSGTTLRTRVAGSSLSVTLGGADNVRFQVEVDGQPTELLQTTGGDQTYEVATGLSPGEHDVQLVRRNEGTFGAVAFLGFVPGAGASIVETPWPYAHRIEIIGDSLTAGYGIEGTSGDCDFSAATESYYGTYGAIAGRNVNAAVHAIAVSGKGVFQNYAGNKDTLMPALWRRTITNVAKDDWDFSRFVPDAVVVNLGTNDFSAALAEADFEAAYAALLGEVRGAYPGAMVFCVTWAHWGAKKEAWVKGAMAATGDAGLRHVRFVIDAADGYGCDYHTNLVTNAKLGEVITQALRTELGW